MAQLYQQRWKVELDFRTLKTHMGMEMLRCKTADMVNKEVAVHLLAYSLIRTNLSRAASLCITLSGTMLEKLILPLLAAMSETEVGKRIKPNQPRVF